MHCLYNSSLVRMHYHRNSRCSKHLTRITTVKRTKKRTRSSAPSNTDFIWQTVPIPNHNRSNWPCIQTHMHTVLHKVAGRPPAGVIRGQVRSGQVRSSQVRSRTTGDPLHAYSCLTYQSARQYTETLGCCSTRQTSMGTELNRVCCSLLSRTSAHRESQSETNWPLAVPLLTAGTADCVMGCPPPPSQSPYRPAEMTPHTATCSPRLSTRL